MVKLVKLIVPVAIVVVAAIGFVPRFPAQGALDQDARNAAFAALNGGGEAAARASAEAHPGVHLMSFGRAKSTITGLPTVQVTLQEKVSTILSGLPGLKGWFRITSTQTVEG